jgi:putative oxidoreductase
MSPVLALLVIVTEFLGPLGLAVGLLTRVVTVDLLCERLVAMVRVHGPHGFFMHWTGTQPGEGFAYHLPVIGIALTALIAGAGAWSLDRALAGHTPHQQAQKKCFVTTERQ